MNICESRYCFNSFMAEMTHCSTSSLEQSTSIILHICELPATDMKPADLDALYAMCVEFSPVPGKLYSERAGFLESLTEITPASRYAVVVRRADVSH